MIPDDILETSKPWETVGTMNNSWGFKSYDTDWKPPREVLYWIIDIASKGGNYMLNVGPQGDGMIPAANFDILKSVGRWLGTNGEAVYGTRAWRTNHEGPFDLKMHGTHERRNLSFRLDFSPEDFWFTKKQKSVYAISFASPSDDRYLIKSLMGEKIVSVKVLGSEAPVKWSATDEGLSIIAPAGDSNDLARVLKVAIE